MLLVSFKTTYVRQKIVLGNADGYISYDSLFTHDKVVQAAVVDPQTATSILLSSSGTSGMAKYVQLSHLNVIYLALQMQ